MNQSTESKDEEHWIKLVAHEPDRTSSGNEYFSGSTSSHSVVQKVELKGDIKVQG